MRIRYTYQKYPNCPRATEYSHSAELSATYGGIFIGLLSFGAIITFLICTFSFFENYNWGEFLCGVVFIIAMSLLNFYHLIIRPNNTACEIKVILTEDSKRNFSQDIVQEYCESLRKENRKQNKKEFCAFYPVFLAILFDVIALIAGIKGVYFLCHKEDGMFLILASIVALCIFSLLAWKFIKGPVSITKTQNAVADCPPANSSTPSNNKKRDFDNKLKTVYIISLVETILAILSLIVCLNLKYSFSKTEIYYFIAIMFCAIGGIAVFYVLMIAKGRQVVLPIGASSFVGAAIPLLNENVWNGGNDDCDLFLAFAVALIIALAVTFISVSIKVVLRAYYSSVNYKIKTYARIKKMSELREQNILSDEEFEKVKKELLLKIEE